MNPIFYADAYKLGHINQYGKNIRNVWTNWTPRNSRIPDAKGVYVFGQTYLIKEYLIRAFDEEFFDQPEAEVIAEYIDYIEPFAGPNPRTDHIRALHKLGYLPIKIYSLPEGNYVPLQVPPLVIVNTLPEFFWLPNYFETLLSNILWKPSTSATTARRYRELFMKHARRAGETDFSFVDYQGHDFSYRGMSGTEDAILSGMGHLTCFSGTDTIPAAIAARKYYSADRFVGVSVPATEHSVMSAGSQDGEFETFERLLTEVYPSGIVSIVSDTWDLWKVLTDYVPRLKEKILARDGKIVIRPDSGDPVKIICGDDRWDHYGKPSADGTLLLLARALGTTDRPGMLPLINKAGCIYGDSITVERADQILTRMIDQLKLSPYNMVFGIGSYTYQHVTRDTYGWAMKATAIRKDGEVIPIFKKPITDDGGKFSAKGILAVWNVPSGLDFRQECCEADLDNCAYEVIFENGALLEDPSFDTIRKRVRAGL